jgi:hypothetical protein
VDTTSWEHVSQNGSENEVVAYLDGANLNRIDLSRIAWRMRDRAVFERILTLLRARHAFNRTLWSYGLRHDDTLAAREYLESDGFFIYSCGSYLDSPLLTIDPIERRSYQHIEYEPLFNGRAHRFGRSDALLNGSLATQYSRLLQILAYRPALDDTDWMSVTYYMLLQDRVAEALDAFARVDPDGLPMRVQYDYARAYLDFFSEDHALARGIAESYRDHPVERWRARFGDVLNQLDEAEGADVATSDPDDRTQSQTALAASEPSLELDVEARRVTLQHKNLTAAEVSYYKMDIEFLFSTSPFVQQGSGSFRFIRPNRRDIVALAAEDKVTSFELPDEFRSSNVLVEVRAGGLVRRQAYYANTLSVQMIETYGHLKVTHAENGAPLPKVYVKVFAKRPDGSTRFHKDGYTDLRGRFDYASLSGEGGDDATRYAILILSDDNGAVIREVAPPAR